MKLQSETKMLADTREAMKLKMIEDENKKQDIMITPQPEMITEADLKVPDSETKEEEGRKTIFIDDEEIHDSDFAGLSPHAQQDIQLLDNVNEALYHYERVNK